MSVVEIDDLGGPGFKWPIDGYQTVAMSAVAGPIFIQPTWAAQMREARQWLEGIRAERERQLRWEYDPAPSFAA